MARTPVTRALLGQLSEAMDLPLDVVMDLPRVQMIGDMEVFVENHTGLIEYTPTVVRLNTRSGLLIVTGRKLRLQRLMREGVLIRGHVLHVEYVRQ